MLRFSTLVRADGEHGSEDKSPEEWQLRCLNSFFINTTLVLWVQTVCLRYPKVSYLLRILSCLLFIAFFSSALVSLTRWHNYSIPLSKYVITHFVREPCYFSCGYGRPPNKERRCNEETGQPTKIHKQTRIPRCPPISWSSALSSSVSGSEQQQQKCIIPLPGLSSSAS